ncbi:MAG: leucine-rich repeat domain-containing protein [Synergistaceae bacterium]|jgi:hypothetical protein|nr:leucine-rich repeat domain-containing protein [Synergistaceae bacterium]
MKKSTVIMKKGAALAVILAVVALTVTVAWAVNSWDSTTKTLTINDPITTISQDLANPREGYLYSGIYNSISPDRKIPGFTYADVKSVEKIIITRNAAQTSSDNPADMYSQYGGVGGLVTWEDMAFLGSSDIWQSLKVIDMSEANTLQGAPLYVANSDDNGMIFRGLEELYLPNGITVIPDGSFNETGVLPGIKYIVFPKTLKSIDSAFHGVGSDNTITLVFTGLTPPAISADALSGSNVVAVIVPKGSESDYETKLPAGLTNNISYIRSIGVSPDLLSSDGGSVDVTIDGLHLGSILSDIRIAVDGTPSDILISPDQRGVNIPGNRTLDRITHTLTVLLKGKPYEGISATVTVLPSDEQPKGKLIRLAPYTTGAASNGIAAYAALTDDGVPSPQGIPVTFTLYDPAGNLLNIVTKLTSSDGTVREVLMPSGLPNGLYTVTATTTVTGYASDTQRVRIGPIPPAYSEDTGSGCSTGVSPLLLIAAVALMGWTSKKR